MRNIRKIPILAGLLLVAAVVISTVMLRPASAVDPLPAHQRPFESSKQLTPPMHTPKLAPLAAPSDFKVLRVWVGKLRSGGGPGVESLSGPVAPGNWVQLVCEYKNIGSDSACAGGGCAGKVVLFADGQPVTSQALQGSPSGQTITVTAPWHATVSGLHTFACALVPDAGVTDAQQGNNRMEGSMTVVSALKSALREKENTGPMLDILGVDLRVTALTVDDATGAVTATVENMGGPMHYDALVRLYQDNVQFKECNWPKGVRTTICRAYCFDQLSPLQIRRCTIPGDRKIHAQIIRNLAEKALSLAGQYRETVLHARQDLAVERLSKDPAGRIKAVFRNRGLCDSGTWSCAAWTAPGQTFATCGTNGGLTRNQQVEALLNPQPPAGAQQVTVKVLPTKPADELNTTNNTFSQSLGGILSGFDLVPTDIRLYGDGDLPSVTPWGYEQAYMVVPVVRNIGDAEMPGMHINYKIFIDGVDTNTAGECSMGLSPGEELAFRNYCLTRFIVPPGEHQVQFVIMTNDANVHNNGLMKTLYRP
jgi:hypothetical protein